MEQGDNSIDLGTAAEVRQKEPQHRKKRRDVHGPTPKLTLTGECITRRIIRGSSSSSQQTAATVVEAGRQAGIIMNIIIGKRPYLKYIYAVE